VGIPLGPKLMICITSSEARKLVKLHHLEITLCPDLEESIVDLDFPVGSNT